MANNIATPAAGTMMDPSTGQPISLGAFGGFGRRRAGSQTPMSSFSTPMGTPPAQQPPRKPFQTGRGLSVTEIMQQRQGRNRVFDDTTGKELQPGTPLYHPGWNTSGVGPGTRGYRGSYADGGYNQGWGTRRPDASNASQYYRNRGSSLDRFSNNASTNNGASWAGIDGFRQYGGPVRRGGRYVVGEDGPEVVVMPQEGYVVPNPRSRRAPSFRNADEYYAYRDQTVGNPLDRGARKWGSPTVRDVGPGFEDASGWAGSGTGGNQWFDEEDMTFGHSAVDRLAGAAEPYDGEVREGRDGRMWRYDAKLGRGVPVSVYEGDNLYAPSPPVELMSPDERYQDIGMRLQAIRQEADRSFADRRRFEDAQFVQPKTVDSQMTQNTVGGRTLLVRYDRGLTTTVPIDKSFTVDRGAGVSPDGISFPADQKRVDNLADFERESRAEAASRRMRGTRAESARRLGY